MPKLCVRLLPSGPLSRIFIQSIREPLVSSTLVFRDAKTCFKERFASIVVDVNSPIGLLVFGEKAEPLTAACSSHIGGHRSPKGIAARSKSHGDLNIWGPLRIFEGCLSRKENGVAQTTA